MTAVVSRVLRGESYQFVSETEELLHGMKVPTGTVTVQRADEMNNIPGRCYVPTSWGTAILDSGDFFVVYENRLVSAFTNRQFSELFELDTTDQLDIPELEVEGMSPSLMRYKSAMRNEVPEEALSDQGFPVSQVFPAMIIRAAEGLSAAQLEARLEEYFEKYRLDYLLYSAEDELSGHLQVSIRVVATGREVLTFAPTLHNVNGYADGKMEIVP